MQERRIGDARAVVDRPRTWVGSPAAGSRGGRGASGRGGWGGWRGKGRGKGRGG